MYLSTYKHFLPVLWMEAQLHIALHAFQPGISLLGGVANCLGKI